MIDLEKFRLQFITNPTQKYSHIDGAKLALDGGCKWIQFRPKEMEYNSILDTASELQTLCKQYDATFIIDDHVEIANEINADGVHLGKMDMPPDKARLILNDKIIGGTANTFNDIVALNLLGIDYIGLGPFRFTHTKKNLSQILGVQGYKQILSKLILNGIFLPIVAIGGITNDDIPNVLSTGVSGIAISGSILNATNPIRETANILTTIKNCIDQ
ncbi:MAG: thiamine phosphate synthase [Ignavibacteria bacterium]|jgi:thiamine-phosphate pyrophosphorylase|nr:thiamine phosphate synthase [Ignavibacteria bacterium]